jgi:hypothetical protein
MATIRKRHSSNEYPRKYAPRHHSDELARLSFRVEFLIVFLAGISSSVAVIYALLNSKDILSNLRLPTTLSDWAGKALLIIVPSLCGFVSGMMFARNESLSRK